MGIDAMPPPASGLPARLVLGPALRAQSDRRLVRLVREGYESAFDEIVRRYRRPLDRFAASLVGGRSEDVTQDSFGKALVALRHGDAEVELRPWLYRIVRNTALNDLRDRPPAAAELAEDLVGGARSAAVEAEERAEVAALVARMQALPENQRAALVMRELEGMSHEEIADTLGISHGAARQAIARARTTVRTGFGALVPLPLLRVLAGGGAEGTSEAVGSGVAAVGTGAVGAGALKVGLATVVVAGSIGAGIAIDHHGGGAQHRPPEAAKVAAPALGRPSANRVRPTPSPVIAEVGDDHGSGSGGDDQGGDRHRGGDDGRHDDGRHRGHGDGEQAVRDDATVSSGDGAGTSGGPGPSVRDVSVADDHGGSGKSGSGRDGGTSGSGSGSSGSSHGGRGSDDAPSQVVGAAAAESSTSGSSSGSSSGGSGSSSGGSGSSSEGGSSSGGSGSTDSSGSSGGGDAPSTSSSSGSSGGPSPSLDSSTSDGDSGSSGGPEISP